MLGGEEIVGGVRPKEAQGFSVDLARGEDQGWGGEGWVSEGEGAEVGGVDLVAKFAGEGEETGEGLLWTAISLLTQAIRKEVLCHVVHCVIIGRYEIFVLESSIHVQDVWKVFDCEQRIIS